MLDRNQFQQGIKVFRSCGGPSLDPQTIEVWYRMLNKLEPEDFEGAVMALCVEETDLGFKNFVAEISQRARLLQIQRERFENTETEQKQLKPGPDCISKGQVTELIESLNIKEVKK